MISNFPHGSGIFETLKTIASVPKYLDLHLMRAEASAKKIGIALPPIERIESQVLTHVAENPVATEAGRLRIEFYGRRNVVMTHVPYVPWTEPAKLTITNSKIDEGLRNVGVKALPYAHNLDLLERARAMGFDEVIRFNKRNQICEGATSNLLLKIGGQWVTPDLASGCLPGITRALCLKWLPIIERPVERDELADVESVFILSSLREIQPASCIGPHDLVIDTVVETEVNARMQAHSLE